MEEFQKQLEARMAKQEVFSMMDSQQRLEKLAENEETLRNLETELRSIELAIDIDAAEKAVRTPRLKTKICEIKEEIEILEELIDAKE